MADFGKLQFFSRNFFGKIAGFFVASFPRYEDEARERFIFYVFSWIISGTAIFYSYSIYQDGVGWGFAVNQLAAGLLIVVNVAFFRFHHRRAVSSVLLTFLTAYIITCALYHGAPGGTGAYWVLGFPMAAFMLMGMRLGLIFNFLFFAYIIAVSVMGRYGIVSTYYTPGQIQEMSVIVVVYTVLGYVIQTSRERLETKIREQRNRLQTLLDNLPVGVLMADSRSGSLTLTNGGMDIIFGRPVTVGTAVRDFPNEYRLTRENGEPYSGGDFPLFEAMSRGKSVISQRILARRPDGTGMVIRCSAAPIRGNHGRVIGAVAIFDDMTKDYEVDRIKSELISLVSHQLRTPLTGLKWSIDELIAGVGDRMGREQSDLANEAASVVGRLIGLVNDLMSVSRIESGRKFDVVRKPADVIPIIGSVVRELATAAGKRRVSVSMSSLPESLTLSVDGDRFREALMNLVHNAIKYSRDGGHVEIGLLPDGHEGSVIFVRDDGIGIPDDQQPRIFERFFRAENAPEDVEGTGLGLYIAKTIIERHDGNLWFESEEGKGTTFYARFR
ncbi:PAS domain-containing protein [Candidatus Uhrbacteria bacterium]|nr:PAS domain-containing protein [Candidatus Uhrbacteria bacterium]